MWDMVRQRRRLEREFPPITPAPRTANGPGPCEPLSPTQRRLWLHERSPRLAGAINNVTMACRLVGELDPPALLAAARAVARRHEALRTVVAAPGGEPYQLVVADLEPWLCVDHAADIADADGDAGTAGDTDPGADPGVDTGPGLDPGPGTGPGTGADAVAERWVAEQAARPFDLAEGPLFRLALLRLTGRDHLLFVAMHHIVSDGSSLHLLLTEVSALYAAARRGLDPPLAPPRLHQVDFVRWQRDCLRGPVLERYLRYGREQLTGSVPALPPDLVPAGEAATAPAPAREVGLAGARVYFGVPAELERQLRTLARQAGTTLFVVMLAGYQALLHLRGGQPVVVLATPAANRGRPELDRVLGYLVNIVPLRTEVRAELTFAELCDRAHGVFVRAYAHQALPLETLWEAVRGDAPPEREPPLSMFFALHREAGPGGLDLPGVRVQPCPINAKDTYYPLAMSIHDTGDALTGRLAYNVAMYRAGTARRLVDEYLALLTLTAADPQRRIADAWAGLG